MRSRERPRGSGRSDRYDDDDDNDRRRRRRSGSRRRLYALAVRLCYLQ